MAKLIFALLFIVMLASLAAAPFEEGLDAALDQMVAGLKSPKTDCIVIAKVGSSEDGVQYYPRFDAYIADHLADYLSNTKQVKVIGYDAVKAVLDSKFKKFKLPSDNKTYQAVLQQLFESTNQTGNVFLAVSIIPDTETGLSSAGFNSTITLYNPNTASKIAQTTATIPMDEFSDKLLGITRQTDVAFVKATPVEEAGDSAQSTPEQASDNGWSEDFSSYAVGDQLTAWGKDAFVFEGSDKRHYLSSESADKYFTNYHISFPDDFILKFDFVGTNFDGNIMFCDNNDKESAATFGREWDRNCYVYFRDNKPSNVNGRDINTMRFEKKGNALKVFINGEFAQSSDMTGMGALQSFKFKIPGKVMFTNFSLVANR